MRDLLTYGSYRLLGALIGPLPPRVGYKVAEGAGRLLYTFFPRLRSVLNHNIRHVLGPGADEAEVQAVVRQACVNIAKGHYDLFRVTRLTADEIRNLTKIEGWEHLERALERGRGVVAFTAHVGNIDVVGQVPIVYGVPLTGAVEHIQPERLFQHLLKVRQSHGLKLIPSDGPMIGLIKALKRGEIIGLPSDRDIADKGRVVEFFGAPARLPDGQVRVALRTGAALLPVFVERLPDNSYVVQIEPELELPQTGDQEADVAAGMALVVAAMERAISQRPEQWLVAQPAWPME